MLAMLVLPAWTKSGPSLGVPVLPAVESPVVATGVTAPTDVDGYGAATPRSTSVRTHASEQLDGRRGLAVVYLLGVAIMLARLIRGTLQARRMVRSVRVEDGFATSRQCTAPVTIGWLRPVDSWFGMTNPPGLRRLSEPTRRRSVRSC